MKMPIADVADRYTILLLKKAHGLQIDENLGAYEKELRGVNYEQLLLVNKSMWEVEELLSENITIGRVGQLCLRLREFSLQRTAYKNKIAQEHGGPIERKTY